MSYKGIIEIAELQKIQDYFSKMSRTFIFCVDDQGEKLTGVSGDSDDITRLMEVIDLNLLLSLHWRVSESTLEDQTIESTAFPNLKLAAVSIKHEGRPILSWLACCVLSDITEEPGCEVLGGLQTKTTEAEFMDTLDLLSMITNRIMQIAYSLDNVEAERRRSMFSENEMSLALKKSNSLTEAVQLLESREAFEEVAEKILRISGSFLDVGSTELYMVSQDGETVDIIGEWQNAGIVSQTDRNRELPRIGMLQSEKPFVVSCDTTVSEEIRKEMLLSETNAFVVMPLYVNGKAAMYVSFREMKSERQWQMEDIKFISDITKILQSLLTRRIQKNSLASSYNSLQAILDNVGSCIYVKDAETGKVLFQNKMLKRTFEREIRQETLEDFLKKAKPLIIKDGYFEVFHMETQRWYDLHKTKILWVDGKEVELYALYDVTDKKIYQQKIEQQAYTDFLTGLFNRMCCERDLSCQVDRAKNDKKTGGLLYLDLDDFKHINDGLGHQYGDVLLKAISHNLQRIRGIENTCYRMGGDEFVIIVPQESYPMMERIIADIKAIFRKPWFLKDADYYCTMSMGVVSFPEDGDNIQDLIKKADIAMYEAKKSGKNRVSHYSDSISSESNKRLDLEKNMRDATTGGYKEFEVYFQPIMDISRKEVPCTGAEALIRWNSATLGFMPPSDFIPLAEYLGLINPIGNHVLVEACRACKFWNDNGHENYKVNVNLSVVQLLQPDIVEIVEKALIETGISPKNLTLEVTENLAINDMNRMKEILSSIRDLGVRIALDDFGTGYSSLNHIREIPLDVIKVDQSFVKDLTEDNYSQSFIKMVGELASAIDVSICVEGIETLEQYKVLEGMKVRLVQGYYFGRPMPLADFEKKYVFA